MTTQERINDVLLAERLQARIDELKQGRVDYVIETAKTLYAMDATIGELTALLMPEDDKEKPE